MRLALFGPPGSGKGTQAAILKDRFSLVHLSTGNMLRAARNAGTPVGLVAKEYMNRGELVPDAVVWEIARAALERCEYEDFVLDGFPRTVQQADWLDEAIVRVGGETLPIVSLEVPGEIILERLSKRRIHRHTGEVYHLDLNPPPSDIDPEDLVQRKDDTPEAIELRLKLYENETAPIKRHYEHLGSLIEVDGVGAAEQVADRIVKSLSL